MDGKNSKIKIRLYLYEKLLNQNKITKTMKRSELKKIIKEEVYISDNQKKESKKIIDDILYKIDKFISRFGYEVDELSFHLYTLGVPDKELNKVKSEVVKITKMWIALEKNVHNIKKKY